MLSTNSATTKSRLPWENCFLLDDFWIFFLPKIVLRRTHFFVLRIVWTFRTQSPIPTWRTGGPLKSVRTLYTRNLRIISVVRQESKFGPGKSACFGCFPGTRFTYIHIYTQAPLKPPSSLETLGKANRN